MYLEGWNFLDSIYFSTITITTLGYGDLVPLTNVGKIFTIFFSLSGIAICLYILTALGKTFFEIEMKKIGSKHFSEIKEGKKVDFTRHLIGERIQIHSKKGVFLGEIIEINLEKIKININRKDGILLPKKSQEIISVNVNGKIKWKN